VKGGYLHSKRFRMFFIMKTSMGGGKCSTCVLVVLPRVGTKQIVSLEMVDNCFIYLSLGGAIIRSVVKLLKMLLLFFFFLINRFFIMIIAFPFPFTFSLLQIIF
jgi:hypothetical protein